MRPSDRHRDRAAEADSARARLASLTRPRPWLPAVPAGAEAPSDEPSAPDPGSDVPAPAARQPGPVTAPRRRWPALGWAGLRDHLPARVRAALLRVELRGGHVGVLAVLGVGAVLAGALFVHAARPEVEPLPPVATGAPSLDRAAAAVSPTTPGATAAAAPAVGGPTAASPSGTVVVDVTGRVRSPGVRRLPSGSRVVDAVRASGGALPGTDLGRINLARLLVDGEQVAVGVDPAAAAPPSMPSGAPAPPTSGSATGGTPPGGASVVDLNTATLGELDALPGVGPVLAQRILDWRTEHGRFSTVEELTEVSGIGDARMADLRPRVRV